MKTFHECLPCFVNQALSMLKRTAASDDQISSAMRAVFLELSRIDLNATPPAIGSRIQRIIRKTVNISDPYSEEKERFNRLALDLLPELMRIVESTQDRFLGKVKLAIAANIIDFGKNSNLTEEDVNTCLKQAMQTPVDKEAVSRLRDAVDNAGSILYLCDNAGEIVFDRFLIEEMPCDKITCVVKGMPVINDATMEDAKSAGLTDLVNVISNGSDAPGTILEECSPEFRKAFDSADIVVSKGQGNFETLSEIKDKRIFFLLQVKCPVIARDIGFPVGTYVIKDN